jgi:acyl-CoA thioesterase FadM
MTQGFRLLRVVIGALFRARMAPMERSELAFRVMPGDLDLNLHMNNARYLAVMDLGRWDLILRTGLWRMVWRRRLQPVVASGLIRYRRPLRPFRRFQLVTALVAWDERWMYIAHTMRSGDIVACSVMFRAAFIGAGKVVPPAELLASVGLKDPPPPLPAWAELWRETEAGLEIQATGLAALKE